MPKLDIQINQTLLNLSYSSLGITLPTRQNSIGRNTEVLKVENGEKRSVTNGLTFREIQAGKNDLNSVAKSIRGADEAMENIAETIGQMKSTLESIVKNYPPFPPGSEERIARLRSLTSLRKQIDQMTFPPDEGAVRIMADPAIVDEAGDWQMAMGDNGRHITTQSRQVEAGPMGLNIPELNTDATDQEIYVAIDDLQSAGDALLLKRSRLAEDALMISQFQEQENEIVQRYPSYQQETAAAQDKSEQIMHALSAGTLKGLTDSRSQLMEML